jgi:hypothetical protein
MPALLSAIRRMGIGFLYGVGFLVGIAVAAMVVMFVGISIFSPQSGARFSLGPTTVESPLRSEQMIFSDTNMLKNNWGAVTVLGTVENKGGATGSYVQLNADLFDKTGKFIYQCRTQLREGLRQSERANFMIECHGAPKQIMESVESFKVYARSP